MISVVIPIYNAEETIFKTLEFLLGQDMDLEIIVVDDASTDNASVIVSQKYPKVKIITNKSNLGRASSRNVGLEATSKNFILFLDADVYLKKDCLKKLLQKINQNDIVYPKIIYPDNHLKHPLKENNNFYPLDSAVFLIKKESFLKNNIKFDPSFKYLEDQDFFIQCKLKGLKAKYVDSAIAVHKIPSSRFSNSKKYYEEMSDICFGIKKYKSKGKLISFKNHFRLSNLIKGFIAALFNYNYFCYPQDISIFKKIFLLFSRHKKFEQNRLALLKLYFKALKN